MSEPKQPPDRIFLQWYGDGEPQDGGPDIGAEICWCEDKVFKHDLEYKLVRKKRKAKQ